MSAAYESHPLEILTIAERVCARPKLYTPTGSLAEVLSIFEGYNLAWRDGIHRADESPAEALRWLAQTCSWESYDPSQRLIRTLQHFGTETEAIEAIAAFLRGQRNKAKIE